MMLGGPRVTILSASPAAPNPTFVKTLGTGIYATGTTTSGLLVIKIPALGLKNWALFFGAIAGGLSGSRTAAVTFKGGTPWLHKSYGGVGRVVAGRCPDTLYPTGTTVDLSLTPGTKLILAAVMEYTGTVGVNRFTVDSLTTNVTHFTGGVPTGQPNCTIVAATKLLALKATTPTPPVVSATLDGVSMTQRAYINTTSPLTSQDWETLVVFDGAAPLATTHHAVIFSIPGAISAAVLI